MPHTPTAAASFRAVAPNLALMAVLRDMQARVSRMHDLITAGYGRLCTPATLAAACGSSEALIRPIYDRDEILKLSLDLINSAREDWMSFNTVFTEMPLTEDYVVSAAPKLRGQVRVRAIYDLATTTHPVGAGNLRKCIEAGEEVRVRPALPMKMQIIDRTAALLPLVERGTGGAVIVYAEPILDGMREFFEMMWEIAVPFGRVTPPKGCPLTTKQLEALRLLAQGLTQEGVAHKTGLSVTTIQRYVSAIKDELKVGSAFAAGAVAQRRGWLDGPEDGNG